MRNLFKRLLPILLIIALLLPCIPALAAAEYVTDPDANMMEDVLNTLGSSAYRNAYNSLLSGKSISRGSGGVLAKGLLKLLDAMGEDVNVKGKVNDNAIECMRHVQKIFGLERTNSLNLEGYKALLFRLLVYKDASSAKDLLVDDWHYFGTSEFNYMRACAYYLKGRYYKAETYFYKSGWGDSSSRAASCARSWPSDGKVWQSSSYKGSHKLIIEVEGQSYNWAEVFKIYDKTKKKHIATIFIGAEGKATIKLPSGKYYVKSGIGQTWYGKKDLFGSDVDYERMYFSDGSSSFSLHSNTMWFKITCSR